MAVTIRDIAKKLNISSSTVSRVINKRDNSFISAETRTRVLQIAAELGYCPNYHALSLHSGRSMAIGLVLDDGVGNTPRFWQSMLGGVEDAARALGYDLVIVGPARARSGLERAVQYFNEHRVDALVVPGYLQSIVGSEILGSFHGPVVLAGMPQYTHSRQISVDCDFVPGINAAVDHLSQLGHRNILWFDVQGRTSENAARRRDAFRSATTRLGLNMLEARLAEFDPASEEENVECARHHFSAAYARNPDATAVMCFNEPTAFGVYAALPHLGRTVPHQLSVIGFDDIHATVASPSMTVVSHMLVEIGRRAAELAIELSCSMENARTMKGAKTIQRQHFSIPSKLIVRKSTALVS